MGIRCNRFYDARHSHATESLRSGEPLRVVAQAKATAMRRVAVTTYAHIDTNQEEGSFET